jgi:hypothetical protein
MTGIQPIRWGLYSVKMVCSVDIKCQYAVFIYYISENGSYQVKFTKCHTAIGAFIAA